MVFEIIGKVVLYIIGTLLCGGIMECTDYSDDPFGIFLGAWIVGVMVFCG